MSKEILFDKYGNEIVKLEVKYNDKLQSICMNCFRIGGVKWNDIDNGSFLTLTLNKKDLINQLVENEVKFDFDEDDDGETVKQVIVDDEKYIDIEYFAKIKADLEAKLAESEERKQYYKDWLDDVLLTSVDHETHYAMIDDYEKQLAEKEKEIERLKTARNCTYKQVEIWKHEFAVEQLEKVRKEFDCENNYCYGDNNIVICINKKIFNQTIDNQIKQLKEGK